MRHVVERNERHGKPQIRIREVILNVKLKRLPRTPQGTEARKTAGPAGGEDRIRSWIITGLMVICPFIFLGLYFKTTFGGLVNPDALDYAQIGRNLSAGHGFVTYILRPLALSHGNNPLQQPDVTHGPLYPFALAIAFGALGVKDHVVVGVSAFFYLATIPVIYLLGMRMFSKAIGALAALIFACNALMLQYATSGLPLTLQIFLMTSLLLVIYQLASHRFDNADPNAAPPKGALVLCGILTALLYLTDPIFIWILPVVAGTVIWLFAARRWQSLAVFALPYLILCLPWMVRNGLLTGNPVFGLRGMDIWAFTRNYYPGDQIYRTMPGDVSPGKEAFIAVVMKIFSGLGDIIVQIPQISASWVLAFFLPSLFFRFADKAVNAVRAAALLCVGAVMVGMLPFDVPLHIPLLTCAVPALLIFSVAYVTYLIQQARLSRRGVAFTVCLVALAACYPVVDTMFLSGVKPAPLKEAASAKALKTMIPAGEVSFSDQPWIVAWYSDHPSIWIPADDNRVADLRGQFDVRWLFVTEDARAMSPAWQYLTDNFERWNMVEQNREANGQPPIRAIRIGGTSVPLFAALNGFTSVPPPANASPTAVIATLPQDAGSAQPENHSAGANKVAREPVASAPALP